MADQNQPFVGMLPQVSEAYLRDPRRMLAESMMQTGQQELNQPTYTPLAALAKALTAGMGGVTSAELGNEYMEANKGAIDTMEKALQAGTGGTDASGHATPGNMQDMAAILAANPYTAPQALSAELSIASKAAEPYTLSTGQQRFGPGNQEVAANTNPQSEPGKIAADAANPALSAAAPLLSATLTKGAQDNGVIYGPNGATVVPGAPQAKANVAGAVAGAQAKETFPYDVVKNLVYRAGQPIQIGPNERVGTGFQAMAGQMPSFRDMLNEAFRKIGITTGFGGTTGGTASTATPQRQGSPAVLPGPPTEKPVLPGAMTPTSAPNGQSAASTTPPIPQGMDPKLWAEVPSVPKPQTPLYDANGMLQGQSKSQIDMEEKANAEKERIDAEGAASNTTLSQLATLQGTINSGQFNTNATMPMRAVVSKYVEALTGDSGFAQEVTGVNPSQAQVFNKDSTRMGLQFARSTEGAREAVAAIKIALGANPSLGNTMAANRQIIGIMQRAAQYDVDTQRASDAFYLKNGHNVSFDGWWNKSHPEADYITGKAMPYDLPMVSGQIDESMLIPGYTYQMNGKTGTWTGKGWQAASGG